MKLENYIIGDEEMNTLIGNEIIVNKCKYKRKQ